jgi:hypothetical protein
VDSQSWLGWMLGKTPINLLVLSVIGYGYAVFLFLISLEKRVNSNTNDQITLIKIFIEHFDVK